MLNITKILHTHTHKHTRTHAHTHTHGHAHNDVVDVNDGVVVVVATFAVVVDAVVDAVDASTCCGCRLAQIYRECIVHARAEESSCYYYR